MSTVGFSKGDSSATYTSFRGGGILANYNKQLTVILTLVGGITVHIKAKDKDTFLDLYRSLFLGADNIIQISYEKVNVRLGGLKLE